MKYIAYLSLIAAVLSVTACSKENVNSAKGTGTLQDANASKVTSTSKGTSALPGINVLQGNWTEVQDLSDIGDGTGKWVPSATSATLGFNADGSVDGTYIKQATYVVKDSVTITFTQHNGPSQPTFGDSEDYRFKVFHDTLEMSLAGNGLIRCVGPCGIRFKKDK